jgi:hypothetical protein
MFDLRLYGIEVVFNSPRGQTENSLLYVKGFPADVFQIGNP